MHYKVRGVTPKPLAEAMVKQTDTGREETEDEWDARASIRRADQFLPDPITPQDHRAGLERDMTQLSDPGAGIEA